MNDLCKGLVLIYDELGLFVEVCGCGLMIGVVLVDVWKGCVGEIFDYVVVYGLLLF